MFQAKLRPATAASRDHSLAIKTIAGFWALHLIYRAINYALDGQLKQFGDPALIAAMTMGVVMSFGLFALLARAARRGLAAGLVLAAALALPTCVAFAAAEFVLHYQISPRVNGASTTRTMSDGTVVTQTAAGEIRYQRPGEKTATVVKLSPIKQRMLAGAHKSVTSAASGWYFFFFGLGTFFVGMSSAERLREAERRAAEFERLAQSAQLRALRYQVNPHFLFNTLNSLSSLIMARRDEEAEAMILSLSAFFRSTLAIDSTDDVTLSEEIALQRLYLEIERVRFPERLHVKVVIPEALEDARVPALLLQPIVENAIKYGVARAKGRVTLEIRATRAGNDALTLVVENDGGGVSQASGARNAPDQGHGTGVGLTNVCERLTARFGAAASCRFGPRGDGGYRVTMTLPLVFA